MHNCSLETALLLATCVDGVDSHAQTLLAEDGDDVDWTVLVETSIEHGVTGLLCNGLMQLPESAIPDAIRHACQQHLSRQRTSNQAAAQQLSVLLSQLAAAGVDAIPFKGPTLAVSAYRDLSLRSFRDLDLLIREQDIETCLKVVGELGYQHHQQLSPRQRRAFIGYAGQDILFGDGLPLEPHWAFAPRTLALDIDYAGLWQRACRAAFAGSSVMAMAPEDELIVLCMHGFKHEWQKLKWVLDLSEFIRQHPAIDWDLTRARLEAQGLARMAIFGLALARQLVNTPLPDAVINWMNQDSWALSEAAELANSYFDTPQKEERSIYQLCSFYWLMRERRRDRWRYFLRTVTQPRVAHFSDIALPDRLFFLYYPYKLLNDYIALPIWLRTSKLRGAMKRIFSSRSADRKVDATR